MSDHSAATLPDVLVLGGGGMLGEAWLNGVLAGLEDATGLDFRRVDTFIGTSAGAIVAARLAGGRPPRRPVDWAADVEYADPVFTDVDADEPVTSRLAGAARAVLRHGGAAAATLAAPVAATALRASAPVGRLVRAGLLGRIDPAPARLDDLHAGVAASGVRFDGRLRIVALDRGNGRRAVFGAPGGPAASVPAAVTASCSVPWLFAPVLIGGREYVDGALWSPTSLDLAPGGRGTRVLCLTPTGAAVTERTLWGAVRLAGRSATEVEALALRRRGLEARVVVPDRPSADTMGESFMDPDLVDEVLAAGYRQGLALSERMW